MGNSPSDFHEVVFSESEFIIDFGRSADRCDAVRLLETLRGGDYGKRDANYNNRNVGRCGKLEMEDCDATRLNIGGAFSLGA